MENNLSNFNTLVGMVAQLRGSNGCPWDRAQTHASLQSSLMEECYEAMEALDKEDPATLKEELGDLLLVLALHAQIASEKGDFNIRDVIESINRKVIYRHPHIFGNTKVKDAGEVVAQWESLKRQARHPEASILDGIPKTLPALAYAYEIQQRAARVGFDWKDAEDILDKLVEEIREVKEARDQKEKIQEFGDLLFAITNYARHLDIELETALRQANNRFFQRFSYMEKVCAKKNVDISSLTLEEQNILWEEAKTIGEFQ